MSGKYFEIGSDPSELKPDANGKVKANVTVQNLGDRRIKVNCDFVGFKGDLQGLEKWITIEGSNGFTLSAGEQKNLQLSIRIPGQVQPGTGRFQVLVFDIDNPEEVADRSDPLTVKIEEPPKKKEAKQPQKRNYWPMALVAGVVLLLVLVATIWFWPRGPQIRSATIDFAKGDAFSVSMDQKDVTKTSRNAIFEESADIVFESRSDYCRIHFRGYDLQAFRVIGGPEKAPDWRGGGVLLDGEYSLRKYTIAELKSTKELLDSAEKRLLVVVDVKPIIDIESRANPITIRAPRNFYVLNHNGGGAGLLSVLNWDPDKKQLKIQWRSLTEEEQNLISRFFAVTFINNREKAVHISIEGASRKAVENKEGAKAFIGPSLRVFQLQPGETKVELIAAGEKYNFIGGETTLVEQDHEVTIEPIDD